MVEKLKCQYCGKEYSVKGLPNHEKACALNPANMEVEEAEPTEFESKEKIKYDPTKQHEHKLKATRDKLLWEKQTGQTVEIFIPIDKQSPKIKHVWGSINGQDFYVPRGKKIKVAKSIAETVMKAYTRTIEAEEKMQNSSNIEIGGTY